MADAYDVIVIGGGHNGLVCGAYLAKSGLKVLVLERREIFGGAAVTEEFVPGFRASRFSYVMSLLHPRVIRDLDLPAQGLTVLPANDLFCPLGGDDYILYSDDMQKTQAEFARFSRHDAQIYPEFSRYLEESAQVVRRLLFETPVDPVARSWGAFSKSAALLWRERRIGDQAYRLVDLLTQSADDYLSAWFESDIIKCVLAYYCSIGTFAGPKSPGSAYVIMHHLMGEHQGAGGWGFIRGGMGAITAAIARSAARFGMQVLTQAAVAEVLVSGGRARGVRTVDGREFRAKAVVSNAAATTLFKRLVAREHLPADLLRQIDTFRTFSTAFKMNIAAESPPRYRAFDAARMGFAYPTYVHIAPGIDYLERAYDEAKYGRFSSRPFLTPVVPTIVDDTLAPAGQHVINVFGGHAPYTLKDASWESEKPKLTKAALAVLDRDGARVLAADHRHGDPGRPRARGDRRAAPGSHLPRRAVGGSAVLPAPGRALVGLPHPRGRALPCGSSTHPGGGVSGIPGHNAAREILKDWKRL